MSVQTSYAINPDRGFAGGLAQPSAPHFVDSGRIYVPAGATRIPRPGDPVLYDKDQNAFRLPAANERISVVGILSYRRDALQQTDGHVQFANGAEVEVAIMGGFWVEAGAAVEYGDQIVWQTDDYKWNPVARAAAIGEQHIRPIECASRKAASDGELIIARIGYGRVI